MQRHALGSATLDEVLMALLDGLKAVTSVGKPISPAICPIQPHNLQSQTMQ